MVDGFVAQSGGAMRIESRLESGTSVGLWLPVWHGKDTDAGVLAPHRSSQDRRSYRVLVVDDDQMVAAGTSALLQDLGHSAIEAASAALALKILETHTVDIVLTDHAMPGMNGTELARHIHDTWPDLPVVLVTGFAEVPNCTDLELPRLSKPYRQHELDKLISTMVVSSQLQVE
jgi:CheY-like chemotaxis protein